MAFRYLKDQPKEEFDKAVADVNKVLGNDLKITMQTNICLAEIAWQLSELVEQNKRIADALTMLASTVRTKQSTHEIAWIEIFT